MDEQPINCIFTTLNNINTRVTERCRIADAKHLVQNKLKIKACFRKSQALVFFCAFQGSLLPVNDSLSLLHKLVTKKQQQLRAMKCHLLSKPISAQ